MKLNEAQTRLLDVERNKAEATMRLMRSRIGDPAWTVPIATTMEDWVLRVFEDQAFLDGVSLLMDHLSCEAGQNEPDLGPADRATLLTQAREDFESRRNGWAPRRSTDPITNLRHDCELLANKRMLELITRLERLADAKPA
jgi:hypothetical protein